MASKQYEYNKVLNSVDWTNEQEHYAHKSCKRTFFKESFLNTHINIEHNETEEITEINQTENDNSNVEPQLSRRSNRKFLEYKSSQEQRKCIICNTDRFLKGRKVALQNLSLKREHDGSYAAEETVKEYAYVNKALNNQRYIEGAKRILSMLNTTSPFAADVSYHRTCYDSFRTSWWKKKLENLNRSTNNPDVEVTNDTPINELFHLIIITLYTDSRYTP